MPMYYVYKIHYDTEFVFVDKTDSEDYAQAIVDGLYMRKLPTEDFIAKYFIFSDHEQD